MKEIVINKEGNDLIFDFYFIHNAQILMSILGSAVIIVFTVSYMLKPYFSINDESYFLLTTFPASLIAHHLYNKYKWLSSRRRLMVTNKDILLYHAGALHSKMNIGDVKDITLGTQMALFFPVYSISIIGTDSEISVAGFKKGNDINSVYSKLQEVIAQRNPV